MNLFDIAALPRLGPVLLSGHEPAIPEFVAIAAQAVTQMSEYVWSAPSAASAAAWLLSAGHAASVDDGGTELPTGMIARREGWVSFYRGQLAKYTEVTASLCSPGSDRGREDRAMQWFSCALNALNDLGHFVSLVPFLPDYMIDAIDYPVPAQHYGIKTELIDWSIDPFVAIFFAAYRAQVGEVGTVLWLSGDYTSGEHGDTFFPPPLVKRLWIQRGLFRRHPCIEEKEVAAAIAVTRPGYLDL